MNIDSIIGGVSPLKQKRGKRGGKAAQHATSTASKRGGFSKTGGKGRRNLAGYNVRTRFKVDPWRPPGSGGGPGGGTTKPGGGGFVPSPDKPYTIGPDGKININVNPNINIQNMPNFTNIMNPNTPPPNMPPPPKPDGTKGTTKETETITKTTPDQIIPGTEDIYKWEKQVTPGRKRDKYTVAWEKDTDRIRTSGMYKNFDAYVADIEHQKDLAAKKDWEALAAYKNTTVEKVKATWQAREDMEKDKVEYKKVLVEKGKDEQVIPGGTTTETKTKTTEHETGPKMKGSPATKREGKYNYGGYRAAEKYGVGKRKN